MSHFTMSILSFTEEDENVIFLDFYNILRRMLFVVH